MAKLTIRAINVNGIRKAGMKPAVICHSLKNTADIICLIDTRLDTQTENNILTHWDNKHIFIHNESKHAQGIAILFSNDRCKLNNIEKCKEGTYAILNITCENNEYLIIPIYAPANDPKNRSEFFKNLDQVISKHANDKQHIIILGDFNVTEHNDLDRKVQRSGGADPSFNELKKVMGKFDLEDAWRKQHPQEKVYTHTGTQNTQSRIDRIYSSRQYRNRISKTDIIPFVHSDHDIVEIKIITDTGNNGKGTWAMNRDILNDEEYKHKVHQIYEEWGKKRGNFKSHLDWWDSFKKKIRRESRTYSYNKKQKQDKYLKSLQKRLKNLQRKANPSTKMIEFTHQLQEAVKQIEIEKVNKHIKGSKARYVEEGERCTRYFFNLENKRKQDITMHEIKKEDGTIATSTEEIAKETKNFYEKLYKGKSESGVSEGMQNIFLSKLDKKLTPKRAQMLEGDITEAETKSVIFEMEKNKSPGLDGIPIEFYQTFYDLLKDDLQLMIKSVEEFEILSQTQKAAAIVSTPKKGDIKELENWRPISLLNADYKIISKILANRIYKVLPDIINEDQTCSISGRRIQNNLSIIRDIIDYANETNEKYCIISIDQKKAFDKVNWKFLRKILNRFQFGERFKKWIEILYTDINSAVKVNGTLSETFQLQQGVRQGCPLSPYLYVLYAEVLAENIRKDNKIKGIQIDKTHHKVAQFADDTNCFLKNDSSIYALDEKLNQFKLANGSEINKDKCHGLWLGANKHRQDEPLGFKWSSKQIKILGLYFGDKSSINKNFDVIADKFIKTLKLWSYRDLSLKGKKIVVNQLAASKLVYASHIFVCPQDLTTKMERATLDFFSKSKLSRIDKNILYLPVEAGGMAVTDINRKMQATRLQWVSRLYREEDNSKWRNLMEFFLDKFKSLNLGKNVFKTYLDPRSAHASHLPQFYITMLKDWVTLTNNKRMAPKSLPLIYNEPLFFNKFIPHTTIYEGVPKMLSPYNWRGKQEFNNFRTIGDMCHQYKKGFHTELELQDMTGNNNIRAVSAIVIKNMPRDWRIKIRNDEPPTKKDNDIKIEITNSLDITTQTLIKETTSKIIYEHMPAKTLGEIKVDKSTHGSYIYTHLENRFGKVNWKRLFKQMYSNHIDKKSTDIQYKVIHGRIATREKLRIAKLHDSGECTRCKIQTETVNHLFIECNKSKELWTILQEQAKILLNTNALLWDIPKIITIGFMTENINPQLKETLEDMRKAYFYAIWKSRNESIWENHEIPAYTLYKDKLKNIFTYRYNKAQEQSKVDSFNTNHGIDKICKIINGKVEIGTPTSNCKSQPKRKNTQQHNSPTQQNKRPKAQPIPLHT